MAKVNIANIGINALTVQGKGIANLFWYTQSSERPNSNTNGIYKTSGYAYVNDEPSFWKANGPFLGFGTNGYQVMLQMDVTTGKLYYKNQINRVWDNSWKEIGGGVNP